MPPRLAEIRRTLRLIDHDREEPVRREAADREAGLHPVPLLVLGAAAPHGRAQRRSPARQILRGRSHSRAAGRQCRREVVTGAPPTRPPAWPFRERRREHGTALRRERARPGRAIEAPECFSGSTTRVLHAAAAPTESSAQHDHAKPFDARFARARSGLNDVQGSRRARGTVHDHELVHVGQCARAFPDRPRWARRSGRGLNRRSLFRPAARRRLRSSRSFRGAIASGTGWGSACSIGVSCGRRHARRGRRSSGRRRFHTSTIVGLISGVCAMTRVRGRASINAANRDHERRSHSPRLQRHAAVPVGEQLMLRTA